MALPSIQGPPPKWRTSTVANDLVEPKKGEAIIVGSTTQTNPLGGIEYSSSFFWGGGVSGNFAFTQFLMASFFVGVGLLKQAKAGYSVITDSSGNWNAAFTHVSSDGSDHTFINQNVTTTGTPTFANLTSNGTIFVADQIEHLGDSNTSIDFLTDRMHMFAGGASIFDGNFASNQVIISNGNLDIQMNAFSGLHIGGLTGTFNGMMAYGTNTPGTFLPNGWNASGVNSRWFEIEAVVTGFDVGRGLRDAGGTEGYDWWYDTSAGLTYFDSREDSDNADTIFRTKTAATPIEAMRIKGNGDIFIPTTNAQVAIGSSDISFTVNGVSRNAGLFLHSDGISNLGMFVGARHSNVAAVPTVITSLRSRGSIGTKTVVQDGDDLFLLAAYGYDGTDYEEAAKILIEVDGTPGANDMPGRIGFYTTPDGAVASVERMRLDNHGGLTFIGTAGLVTGEIYASDVNDTITISASGQANRVQVTSFDTDGYSNNMTPDHTNDHITVDKAGWYLCIVSIAALSAAGSGYEVGFAVYKNNGATEFVNTHAHRDLTGGGGDTGSIVLSGIIDLAVSDTVELWTWNETNTTDVIIDDVTMTLIQIAGT